MDSSSRYNFTVIIDFSVFCLLFSLWFFLIVFWFPSAQISWKDQGLGPSSAFVWCHCRSTSIRRKIIGFSIFLLIHFLSTYSYLLLWACTNFHCQFLYISYYLWFRYVFKTRVWDGRLLSFSYPKIVAVSIFFSRAKHGGDVFYFSLLSTFAFDVCFFLARVAMKVTGRGRKWSRSLRVEWNMYRVWGYIRRVTEIVPVSFLWWFIEMIVYYYFYSLLTYLSILCCWFHLLFCGIALGG